MAIYIEVLVIFAMVFMVIVWAVWNKVSRFIIKRRYKQEDDKGWLGEEHRKKLIGRGVEDPIRTIKNSVEQVSNGSISDEGQGTSSTGTDIQTTDVNVSGENSSGTRKGNCFRKFFRRKK